MDIRGMDEESIVLNLAGEKIPLPDVIYCSTPPKTQLSAVTSFLSMTFPETASAVVVTGTFSGTGSLSSSTTNLAFLSSEKSSHVIFFPALILSVSNCLSS